MLVFILAWLWILSVLRRRKARKGGERRESERGSKISDEAWRGGVRDSRELGSVWVVPEECGRVDV